MPAPLQYSRSGWVNYSDFPVTRLDVATGAPVVVAPHSTSVMSLPEREVLNELGSQGNWATDIADIGTAAVIGMGGGLLVGAAGAAVLGGIEVAAGGEELLAVGADEAEVLESTDALASEAEFTAENTMGDEWMNLDEWGGSGGLEAGNFVGDLPLDEGAGVLADTGAPYNVMQLGQMASGAMSLGRALLTRAGVGAARVGASAAGKIVMNGVTMSVRSLWPAIRKYGPQAVAAALGVSVATLMEMAMAADPSMGARRRRGRGISARDVRTTRRVVNFVTRISHQIGCVRAPRHFARRSHASR